MILLNDKYKPLFENKTRYNIISGGRGSGKSFSVALYLLLLTFEDNRTILFARYTMTSIAISIFPEFKDKIEMLDLQEIFDITKSEIINKRTGSKIIFRGIKTGSSIQTANLKSIANVDTLVIDEAEEIPDENTFDKIDLSIRSSRHYNKIIILFNPTTKASWIYERFFEKRSIKGGCNLITDDVTYIHTTYKDVEDKLPDSLLESIRRRQLEDPKWYEHIILGGFLDVAEGVIFTNWEIGEFTDQLDFGFGMDFGFSSDASTLTKVAVDTKNKIIYLDELLYKTGLTTTEIYNSICDLVGKCKIIADNSEPRLIEELKRKGLNIEPCVKGAGSIAEGITLMQDYKLIITSQSINIIKELNNYVWNDRKSGTPIDMYNHSLDGIRYYVTHILKNIKAPFRLKVR